MTLFYLYIYFTYKLKLNNAPFISIYNIENIRKKIKMM